MTDAECVALLRWALPRLELRFAGFRRVRRQVCRRIGRRMRELGLEGASAYRVRLETDADEWRRFDAMCRITISRCFRDREVFAALGEHVFPALAERARAAGRSRLAVWSAGCASGEEPYSLALLWRARLASRHPGLELAVLATDADAALIERARAARFAPSSLREVPEALQSEGFEPCGGELCARAALREAVSFACQDLRHEMPAGPFDLVLCRNLAFSYFDEALQRSVLARLLERMYGGGALVIGLHEALPEGAPGVEPWPRARAAFRRVCPS